MGRWIWSNNCRQNSCETAFSHKVSTLSTALMELLGNVSLAKRAIHILWYNNNPPIASDVWKVHWKNYSIFQVRHVCEAWLDGSWKIFLYQLRGLCDGFFCGLDYGARQIYTILAPAMARDWHTAPPKVVWQVGCPFPLFLKWDIDSFFLNEVVRSSIFLVTPSCWRNCPIASCII